MSSFDSRRGGIISGFLVSGLVVVCLLIAAGLFVARNIRVRTVSRDGGDDVSIDTPGGHLSIRAQEKSGSEVADVPVYPGARDAKNWRGNAVIQWNSNSGKSDGGPGCNGFRDGHFRPGRQGGGLLSVATPELGDRQ